MGLQSSCGASAMNLRILGPRILVRNYTLPEKIGSLFVPDYVQSQFDGRTYEVVAVGDMVSERLAVGMVNGENVYPVLADGTAGLDPLVLEPDDIIMLRYMFRGVWAGPEIRDHFGYDCWFVGAIEDHGTFGPMCAISKVWPSRHWKQEAA